MKRTLFFMACVLASLTMSAQDDLTVGDIQNSGCLAMTRGEESEPLPTIVLTKEGSILSVQLLNYESNCGTTGFEVTPTVNNGRGGDPLSVSISVVPRLPSGDLPACDCPHNVSFTVRDWEAKSFYLSCWWYKGMVELTEGKPLVLEYKVGGSSENASVQHPVDMTSRIVNPRFDNNDVTTGWSGTRFGNWNAKENAEIYNDKYDAFQKIEGLPAGVYAVGVKAFYMAGEELQTAFNHYKANDEASHYVKLYTEANGRQTEVDICSVFDNQVKDSLGCTGEKSLYDEETGRTYHFPKDLAAAERYMHELNCYDNKVLAMTDGSLTIGVRKNSVVYGDWSVFDDFTLTYYGQGADAYQMYLDDIREKNLNKTIVAEGTLYTKYYIDEYSKHRYATTEEGVNVALADIQGAYSLLQRNIELWKEWKLAMNRGRALAASPYYAGSEQAQLLAQHCGVEATETEAARNLTNEQLETEISKTEAMINTLYNQEGFANKMLKEGKQWVYSRHRDSELYDENGIPYDMVEVVTKVTFTINGDTLINGRHYAKLYKQEEGQPTVFYMALREEGTTVYSCVGNEDKRLIEFNPYHFRDVQSLSYFEDCFNTIDVVDDICVNDRVFVRHKYEDENGSIILPIGVEGIGYESNGILGMSSEYTPSDYIRFEACYEDGECIFTAEDFNGQTKPIINIAYRPLVEEGKHWTYDNFLSGRPAEYNHYYYYELKGDTLIAGKKCLKMYVENMANNNKTFYYAALYEENKKVYCFESGKDKAKLLYDFDCKVGDTIHVSEGRMVVKDIRTEDNGGISIRKYILQTVEDDLGVCWIEGVGCIKDFFGMLPLPGNYNSLNACELNGEKLYQWIEPDYTAKGYHKMGIEGKRWNYIHYYVDEYGEHRDPYSYVVKGDTIIRRTTYKKLWYQDEKSERLVCLLSEVGREVLKSLDFGDNAYGMPIMTSFFVFSREDFGRVFTWKSKVRSGNTNWMVYGVDTINVNNRPFRRYTCLQKYSDEGKELSTIAYGGEGVWHDIWVEGVGSATSGIEDQIPYHEPPVRQPNDYTYFVSCYEDGECIFTADDFNAKTDPKPVEDMAYRPFVEDGKVWKVGNTQSILDNVVQVVDYYYFDGDTIVGGKTCKQMMCQRYVSPDHSNEYWTPTPSLSKVGAWYEEDKKVYFYDESKQAMVMKYDFSLAANDTLQFLTDWSSPFIIGPKQTGGIEGFKGVYRDIRMCGDEGKSYHDTFWLEGVGCIRGPISSPCNPILGDPRPEFLMSCTVGDEVIYLNDEYEDGATPDAARKQRIDFTHTIKTRPKSRMLREEAEQTLYGEYNDQQLGINLDPLDDAYVVRIIDQTGRVVYEKDVNAGSIVGLNIDISDYAEGRYTVTVENNDESFTAQFDTQRTSISLTPALSHREGAIYNLQGQRLSSLQKGLNIVDGRKVFVK